METRGRGPGGTATRWLAAVLARPEARGLAEDSPPAVAVHVRILRTSPFLRRLYLAHYRRFAREFRGAPPGPVLELGSGAGFLREVMPDVVTTDVVAAPGVARVMAAERLEVADGSLAGILMLNVFHHLPDPAAFLREADRALMPGGRLVMIEPAHTPLGFVLYRAFSPEPYDPRADWGFPAGGRLTSANVPQAWIVFVRDRDRFEREFPGWRVRSLRRHTAFLFVLAGGFRYCGVAPGWSFGLFAGLEWLLAPAMPLLAGQMTVTLEKAL
ncbi:MAG: methyltransferase domain-containing protein [Candidatus Coatesbacteria bacterium]